VFRLRPGRANGAICTPLGDVARADFRDNLHAVRGVVCKRSSGRMKKGEKKEKQKKKKKRKEQTFI
jgi:hypothetical protein